MAGVIAGEAFVRIGAILSPLQKGLNQASSMLSGFASKAGTFGASVAGAGAAITGPMGVAANAFKETGDALIQLSQKTGMSVEDLSSLQYAANSLDVDMATVTAGIGKMQRTLGEAAGGSEKAQAAFAGLGLDVKALLNSDPSAQFAAVAKALGGIQDPAVRAAKAQAVLGRGAQALIPTFKMLEKEGFAGLGKAAEKAGVKMTDSMAAKASVLDDVMDSLNETLRGVELSIGEALAPTLSAIGNLLTRAAEATVVWVKDNKDLVVTVFEVGAALVAVGTAIAGVAAAALAGSYVLAGLSSAASAIAAVLSPVGLAVLAVGAAFVVVGDTIAGFLGYANIGIAEWVGRIKIAGASISTWLNVAWMEVKNSCQVTLDYISIGMLSIKTSALAAANYIAGVFWKAMDGVRSALRRVMVLMGDAKAFWSGEDTTTNKAKRNRAIDELLGTNPLSDAKGQAAEELAIWQNFHDQKAQMDRDAALRAEELGKAEAKAFAADAAIADPLQPVYDKAKGIWDTVNGAWDEVKAKVASATGDAEAALRAGKKQPGQDAPVVETKIPALEAFGSFSAREVAGLNTTMTKQQEKANNYLKKIMENTSDMEAGLA